MIKKSGFVVLLGLLVSAFAAKPIITETPEQLDNTTPFVSKLGEYENAAVASDHPQCSKIGADILRRNGSVADAAIASLVCLGVLVPESMGLGGGFFATYYKRSTGQAFVLDAREAAPAAATQNMFMGDPELSAYGGLSVAVPGQMKGYKELFNRFGGSVSWESLFESSIELCEDGFPVPPHFALALDQKSNRILDSPSLSNLINPDTDNVYVEGEIFKQPDMAKTLRALQSNVDAIHSGHLTEAFLQDLHDHGSIITREDLENYVAIWRDPQPTHLTNGDYTIYSVPPPGSGMILGFILNILDNYDLTPENLNYTNAALTYHHIAESFKHAYAQRTKLADIDYADLSGLIMKLTSDEFAEEAYQKIMDNRTFDDPDYYGAAHSPSIDSGTSHLSIVGPNGDAIAVTSSINLYFGASFKSNSTGIILNDSMDDFSSPNITNSFGLPPFPGNYIEPGKRPVSSMCPAVIVNGEGDVSLAVGAAGGSKISTATAWVTINNLWLGQDIKQSIDSPRLHHQLFPMKLQYQEGFNEDLVADLEDIGHVVKPMSPFGSVVCGVARDATGKLFSNADHRKEGGVDGF